MAWPSHWKGSESSVWGSPVTSGGTGAGHTADATEIQGADGRDRTGASGTPEDPTPDSPRARRTDTHESAKRKFEELEQERKKLRDAQKENAWPQQQLVEDLREASRALWKRLTLPK
jgi:hypothetical protein